MPVDTIDLSPRGAAVIASSGLPPETLADLLLDGRHLPAGLALPPIAAVVKTVRRSGPGDDGAPLCRLGLRFQPMPPGERRALRILTRRILGLSLADTGADAIDPVVAPALAGSARGRELLYQAAFEKLEQKQFERARALADWAHRGEPKNPFYRSLLHRIRAEESLFCGDHDDAARELKLALDLVPDDDELLLLRTRIDTSTDPGGRPPGTGRTYLSKLLR